MKKNLAFILEVRRKMERTQKGFRFRSTFHVLPPNWFCEIPDFRNELENFAESLCVSQPHVLDCAIAFLGEEYALMILSGENSGEDDWVKKWSIKFLETPIEFECSGMSSVSPCSNWAGIPDDEIYLHAQKTLLESGLDAGGRTWSTI